MDHLTKEANCSILKGGRLRQVPLTAITVWEGDTFSFNLDQSSLTPFCVLAYHCCRQWNYLSFFFSLSHCFTC